MPKRAATSSAGDDGDGADLESLTIPQLKELCRKRGLAVGGSKAVLVQRLSQGGEDETGKKASSSKKAKPDPAAAAATSKSPKTKKAKNDDAAPLLAEVAAVAASGTASLALTADGKVLKVNGEPHLFPRLVAGLDGKRVAQIACGSAHGLLLCDDGVVYGIGKNSCGQLALPDLSAPEITEAKPIEALKGKKVRAVFAGFESSAVVTADGVFAFGENRYGQLGTGDAGDEVENAEEGGALKWGTYRSARVTRFETTPTKVALDDSNITKIAFGQDHGLFLSAAGKVYSTGCNLMGQLGLGNLHHESEPLEVKGAIRGLKVADVAASDTYSVAVTDKGLVYHWGRRGDSFAFETSAKRVEGVKDVVKVAATQCDAVLITKSGQVITTAKVHGYDDSCNPGVRAPKAIATLGNFRATDASCGKQHGFIVMESGALIGFGPAALIGQGKATHSIQVDPVEVQGLDGSLADAANPPERSRIHVEEVAHQLHKPLDVKAKGKVTARVKSQWKKRYAGRGEPLKELTTVDRGFSTVTYMELMWFEKDRDIVEAAIHHVVP